MKGIDSSLLVYAMDPTTDEHSTAMESVLSLQRWAVNPTVVHEVYHTLAFKRRMSPEDARAKLLALIRDQRTIFLNITKRVSLWALELATEFKMGGRDSLIVGCYMFAGMATMLTHDRELLDLRALSFKGKHIEFVDPLRLRR